MQRTRVLLSLAVALNSPSLSVAQNCAGRTKSQCKIAPNCALAAVQTSFLNDGFAYACETIGSKSFCAIAKDEPSCNKNSGCAWQGKRCDLGGNGGSAPAGGGSNTQVPPTGGGGGVQPSNEGSQFREGSRRYCRNMGRASESTCTSLPNNSCRWKGRRCRPNNGNAPVNAVGGAVQQPQWNEGSRRYCLNMGAADASTCNGLTGCAWDVDDQKCRRGSNDAAQAGIPDAAGTIGNPLASKFKEGSRRYCAEVSAGGPDACGLREATGCKWDVSVLRCKMASRVKDPKVLSPGSQNYCAQGHGSQAECLNGLIGCMWVHISGEAYRCKKDPNAFLPGDNPNAVDEEGNKKPPAPCDNIVDEYECKGQWNCLWRTHNNKGQLKSVPECAQNNNA